MKHCLSVFKGCLFARMLLECFSYILHKAENVLGQSVDSFPPFPFIFKEEPILTPKEKVTGN